MSAPQPNPVSALLDWLVAMDEPDSVAGMEARRTVTLSAIIERARGVQQWLDLANSASPETLPYPTDAPPRLWQIDHPYYGADGYETDFSSFAELKHAVDDMDEDMNVVYRWDWHDYRQPHFDDLFLDDQPRGEQRFKVFWLMPRKSAFGVYTCPISHDQENEVVAWLRGPRCAGYLRTLWEPILGRPETGGDQS